ncbi:hypothetical protein HUJ04_006073 [Dendroctonus ponderosae]|nr:hypothetical protein HUJ04_006073 [Dendroctonus ponderosae]
MRLCVISDLTLAIGALKEEQIFKALFPKTNINLLKDVHIDFGSIDKPAYNVGKLHQKEAEMEETK